MGDPEAGGRRLHHGRRESARKQQLAAGDARAQEPRRSSRPTSRRRAVLPDHPVESRDAPAGHVPRDRRPLGIARSRDHRRRAARRRRRARRTSSTAASRSTSASACARRSPIDDFVVGVGIFNAEGVCCYGTNTDLEELKSERIFGDAEVDVLDREPRSRRRHLQAGCRGAQARRLPYDYHRLLYTFRVKSRTKDVGIYRPRHAWRFSERRSR